MRPTRARVRKQIKRRNKSQDNDASIVEPEEGIDDAIQLPQIAIGSTK